MIITRTPFRISFAGGGSDFEAFHREEPGVVLSTAIDKYMYVAVKSIFGSTFRVSYSKTENVDRVSRIRHPIVRTALETAGVKNPLEIVSMADLPARAGMGSSSSFTVGLLHALYAHQGRVVSARQLAEDACAVEIDKLHEPIGKQDQYIAAFGGLQLFTFEPDGTVRAEPVITRPGTRAELNRRLLLFFSGLTRDAGSVLKQQTKNLRRNRAVVRRLCEIALEMRVILTKGQDLNRFGALLHDSWETKKQMEQSITNPRIDRWYEKARQAGALGGKLLGAGNGGFLLLYCEPHLQDRVREQLHDMTELPFRFEAQGSSIVHVGEGALG